MQINLRQRLLPAAHQSGMRPCMVSSHCVALAWNYLHRNFLSGTMCPGNYKGKCGSFEMARLAGSQATKLGTGLCKHHAR